MRAALTIFMLSGIIIVLISCSSSTSYSPSEKEIRTSLVSILGNEAIDIEKLNVIDQVSQDKYNRTLKTTFEVKATLNDNYLTYVKKYLGTKIFRLKSKRGETVILYGTTYSVKDKMGKWEHKTGIDNIRELLSNNEIAEKNIKGEYVINGSRKEKELLERYENYMADNKAHHDKVLKLWTDSVKLTGSCLYCKYPNFSISTFDLDKQGGVITWYSSEGEEVASIELEKLSFRKDLTISFFEKRHRKNRVNNYGAWWDLKYITDKRKFVGKRDVKGQVNTIAINIEIDY